MINLWIEWLERWPLSQQHLVQFQCIFIKNLKFHIGIDEQAEKKKLNENLILFRTRASHYKYEWKETGCG